MLANWVPDVSPDFGSDPTALIVVMAIGFVVGVAGHLTRSRAVTAIGIGLIFLAVFVLPLAANLFHR